jgi:general secretion pathway protein C
MVTDRASNWTVRGVTFVVWVIAAASAAYWVMKFAGSDSSVPRVAAASRQPAPADPMVVARLLGHTTTSAPATVAQPSVSSRLSLIGVVADRSQRGAALIAVDGKPAKPYRVGTPVEEGLVLQSVEPRKATLGASVDGPASVTLELPLPATAGAGTGTGTGASARR